jgi:hypothetical protein
MGAISFILSLLSFAAVLWFHFDAAQTYMELMAIPVPAGGSLPTFTIPVETKVTIMAPALLSFALGGIALQRKQKMAKAALVFSSATVVLAIIPLWRVFL